MSHGRLILVGGGARSGKSAFSLDRARQLGQRRTFVATAQAFDAEMSARIARHRAERSDEFETVEAPIELEAAIEGLRARAPDVVIIDCLTLWLSNLLLAEEGAPNILARVDALAGALRRSPFHAIIVTNEVGMGIVPESALGRLFRDLAGFAHQRLAREADEIFLAILGTVLRIKPGPVELQELGGMLGHA